MIRALRQRARVFGVSAGAAAILLSACGQAATRAGSPASPAAPAPSSTLAPSPSAPAPSNSPAAIQVGTRSITGIGLILDSSKGFTLYHLTTDTSSRTTCTGSCSQTWPPLLAVNGKAPIVPGLMGTFGTLTRPDGTVQVTFDGKPLYMFAGDARPGQANGQGIGGVWFAVKA